ncbi:MAG: TRASH domain-containing protein [Candidatus Omnitrophica bacterium]|nr:TRASH domain-containing protein [Candidatus Omnitrophota bacterium]
MKRLLVIAVTGIFMMSLVCGCAYAQAKEDKSPVNVGNTVCPVLGTKITPGTTPTVEYNGKIYNVCCPMCIGEFKNNPEKYVAIVEKQMKEQGK